MRATKRRPTGWAGESDCEGQIKAALLALDGLLLLVAAWIYLNTLPGLRRLPKERRVSLDGVTTLDEAAEHCRRSGLGGGELVGYAQKLAARKFSYSRRNPWDSPARAFARGLGYCQQQALALQGIYDRLGIQSQPVYAVKCRFSPTTIHGMPEPERVSGHTWLRVTIGDESRDVCPGRVTNRPGFTHFEVLSPVRRLKRWMRPFSHLGSVIENARRDRRALRRQGKV